VPVSCATRCGKPSPLVTTQILLAFLSLGILRGKEAGLGANADRRVVVWNVCLSGTAVTCFAEEDAKRKTTY
jgi:hypothetical protein